VLPDLQFFVVEQFSGPVLVLHLFRRCALERTPVQEEPAVRAEGFVASFTVGDSVPPPLDVTIGTGTFAFGIPDVLWLGRADDSHCVHTTFLIPAILIASEQASQGFASMGSPVLPCSR
jgi:hypothetical protein